ncbi:cupredoxin domain-containing protein [Elongatibacter sediminis]|uniref:Multicopper oxidase domain-containing protein n=1 Tax=Elongatibacter sediminis TaxID=3119006 RepID=A0AAW9RI27_9GAMM
MRHVAASLLAGLLLCGFADARDENQADPDPMAGHQHHAMSGDASGTVMNANTDRLPRDCAAVGEEANFTIHAGREHAAGRPGHIFGMSQHEVRVPPCSRVSVTFVNDDEVRHQWMVHGLPRYLYPGGMFHIEVAGGHQRTGTFIVPGEDRTYLIHCDIAQHMEKGMRGQLVVGAGSGDLWGVAGISDDFYRSSYLPGATWAWLAAALAAGLVLGFALLRRPAGSAEK